MFLEMISDETFSNTYVLLIFDHEIQFKVYEGFVRFLGLRKKRMS